METVTAIGYIYFNIGNKADNAGYLTPRYFITLPKLEDDMTDKRSDVEVHLLAAESAKFQKVEFGVRITLKDVPLKHVEEYARKLQGKSLGLLKEIDEPAQDLLAHLVDSSNQLKESF